MKAGEKLTKLIHLNPEILKDLGYDTSATITMDITVAEASGTDYGNKTCTIVNITDVDGRQTEKYYDTRYFIGTIQEFAENVIGNIYDWNRVDYVETLGTIKTFRYKFYANKQQVKQKTIHAETWDEADQKVLEYMRKKHIDFDEWTGSQLK